MVLLMFVMLCPPEDKARPRGRLRRRHPTARPKRRSSATTAARAGGAGKDDGNDGTGNI
jgi:hypothetical protein